GRFPNSPAICAAILRDKRRGRLHPIRMCLGMRQLVTGLLTRNERIQTCNQRKSGTFVEARAIALFDTGGETLGRELARDLRALEGNAWQQCARLWRVARLIRQGEHTPVQFGAFEIVSVAL